MNRSEITAAALTLVGTPFHAQGRLPGVGLDCIGVIVSVARQLNIPHKDVTAYPMRPNGQLMPELESQLLRVKGEPQEGDILMMAFAKEPHHLALLIEGERIVHAFAQVRRCVVQPFTPHWKTKVKAVFRFPGVE